ncbi:MAG: hypothetical protein QOE91_1524 [Gaiellaceae bacterium]|jgi:hypothetical protein|nr:hypothetical protein [Gaiellaceae bacterium]
MLDRLPRLLLRLEGLAVAGGAVVLYFHEDFGWILFVVLILAPDLSFVAYAFGPKVGAIAYDAVHTELFPVALGTLGVIADSSAATKIALIWLAHIGADRLLGYGLKYPTAFADTHLSRV